MSLPSESTLQDIFWTVATLTQNGQAEAATATILSACNANMTDEPTPEEVVDTYTRVASLIVTGSDICAVTMRRKLDSSRNPLAPLPDGEVMAMELVTSDGRRLSYDEATGDPCCATALRCITAGLNHDLDLLADVLKAHMSSHGLVSLLEVVADLIGLYLAFTEGQVDRGVFDFEQGDIT